MIISVIRTKVLAVLIGAGGYGIFGLLTSTIELVRQATGLSIETSGVKKIAESNSGDKNELSSQVNLLLYIALFTGIFGAIITTLFARLLSDLTFGNQEKFIAIAFVAVTIIFKQLTSAQSAVMQGTSNLKLLAKSNFIGNAASLIITLPIFYFYEVDAIVPAIILTSVINYFVSKYFLKKLSLQSGKIPFQEVIKKGKEIYIFGAMLSLSAFLPVLSNYFIQVFIRLNDTIETVGLFNAGQLFVNAYVGVIFTIMATEYYPRLAAMKKNSVQQGEAFNQQAIISVLIIVPVIVVFMFFKDLIIKLLFSSDFAGVVSLLVWAVPAMLFKAVSLSLGYIIIARADSAVFIKTAIVYNSLYFILCTSGFYLYGLEGLGIGFCIYFLLHLTGNYLIIKSRYGINITDEMLKVLFKGLAITILGCLISSADKNIYSYLAFGLLFTVTAIYAVRGITKRAGLKKIFKKVSKKDE